MPSEEKDFSTNEYRQICQTSRKMRKKVFLIVLCALFALIILLCGVILIENLLFQSKPLPNQTPDEFYPTYQGNIMEYDAYLELNRQIDYCSEPSGYGVWESITDENREDFDAEVLFLYDYLQTVIAGDINAYNACFSELYFKSNDPKGYFSPQMIYNVKIRYISTEVLEREEKRMTYLLEYMIFQNDGSFHNDVGSDASMPRYVTLHVTKDEQILIEQIVTKYVSVKQ